MARKEKNVIAVIGDGAMTAGMAYEAMNNAGSMDSKLIVIPTDITKSLGSLSALLEGLSSR